jgi:hypothetical protein
MPQMAERGAESRIENLNEQLQGIFEAPGQVPTKRLVNTPRFVLGAVFVYQLSVVPTRARARSACQVETISQGGLSQL